MSAVAAMLPDGRRLHLQHGPIDLVIEADAGRRDAAYALAARRFRSVLDELVAELPVLRRPVEAGAVSGPVARRMEAACLPHRPAFVTPMAAVAGAVADEILSVMAGVPGLRKAWVNDGGDVALHLTGGERFVAAMAGGQVTLSATDPWRGVATSGWRGRSHSLGIADAVTVVAQTAAAADVAATLIANAVDLPGHAAIARRPALELAPDSDLGDRLVTVDVGPLGDAEVAEALGRGLAAAQDMRARGLIGAAFLTLNDQSRAAADIPELAHA
jgi:uncharacterized protein